MHDIPNFSRTDGGGDLGKSPAVLRGGLQPGRARRALELRSSRWRRGAAWCCAPPITSCRSKSRSRRCARRSWRPGRSSAARSSPAAAAAEAVKRLTAGEPWDSVAKSLGRDARRRRSSSRAIGSGGAARGPHATPSTGRSPRASRFIRACRSTDGDAAVVALSAVREDPSGDPKAQERGAAARIRASGCGRRGAGLCRRRRAPTPR